MERMTDESHKKRKHLEHEMTETLTAQVRNSLSSFEFVNLEMLVGQMFVGHIWVRKCGMVHRMFCAIVWNIKPRVCFLFIYFI